MTPYACSPGFTRGQRRVTARPASFHAPVLEVSDAGGLSCLFERGLDSVGDEVERGPSLHHHGITRVMGENEHGVVIGRVVAPPARPLLVAPGATADRAEHVSAHHAGPEVLARFLDYP